MKNIYEIITSKFIEELQKGVVPWQKPWITCCAGADCAISHANGKPYSLLNQMLLSYKPGEWLSYKQITDAGGHIKKGEKPSIVVFWKFVPKTEENEDGEKVVVGQFPMLKYYNVWHIDQCEGVKAKFAQAAKTFETEPIEAAEKVVNDYFGREACKLFIENRNDAFYSSSKDEIHVPSKSQFKEISEYYSTLFHEAVHSSGAADRLNRKELVEKTFFGSEDYSKEELVAEMGSAFILAQLGITNEKTFKNSAAYVQNWLKVLKSDPKMVVHAASKAERAAEYILAA